MCYRCALYVALACAVPTRSLLPWGRRATLHPRLGATGLWPDALRAVRQWAVQSSWGRMRYLRTWEHIQPRCLSVHPVWRRHLRERLGLPVLHALPRAALWPTSRSHPVPRMPQRVVPERDVCDASCLLPGWAKGRCCLKFIHARATPALTYGGDAYRGVVLPGLRWGWGWGRWSRGRGASSSISPVAP